MSSAAPGCDGRSSVLKLEYRELSASSEMEGALWLYTQMKGLGNFKLRWRELGSSRLGRWRLGSSGLRWREFDDSRLDRNSAVLGWVGDLQLQTEMEGARRFRAGVKESIHAGSAVPDCDGGNSMALGCGF